MCVCVCVRACMYIYMYGYIVHRIRLFFRGIWDSISFLITDHKADIWNSTKVEHQNFHVLFRHAYNGVIFLAQKYAL